MPGQAFETGTTSRPRQGVPARAFLLPRAWLAWLCLAAIVVLFIVYLKSLPPQGYFGAFNDDAYYFGSAKALAQGRGYIIPSLPGCPPQTKTPVLYPWLLSWVWRWFPSFPSNITPAAWVTAFFGCWFLVAAFELLRRLKGVGDRAAIVIVTLCAFHPTVLLLSRTVMTDVPFAALVLTAAFAADGAMRTEVKPLRAVMVGILAGLAVMTRTMGIVVVAGVAAAAAYRRAYRQGALFCLAAAPFLVYVLWSSRSTLAAASVGLAHGAASAFPGYEQTLVYYTCYQRYWQLCVPRLSVFFAMLPTNLGGLLQAAPLYMISPTLEIGKSLTSVKHVAGDVICGVVSALVVAGLVRQARSSEWKPIHFIMAFNAALMLVWNWPIADRYNLAFLPLFYMGSWLEVKHLVHLLLASWRKKRPIGERVLAGMMLTGVAALSAVVLWNYVYGYRPKLLGLAWQRSLLGLQKAQVYDWIRRNTDRGVTIMTYDDASMYLYTGRTAMPPLAFSTEYNYTGNKRVLERDLARLTDAARAVAARYWLVSDDDVPSQVEQAQPLIKERIESLLSQMPEVFHSSAGRVRLYDISRLVKSRQQEPDPVITAPAVK